MGHVYKVCKARAPRGSALGDLRVALGPELRAHGLCAPVRAVSIHTHAATVPKKVASVLALLIRECILRGGDWNRARADLRGCLKHSGYRRLQKESYVMRELSRVLGAWGGVATGSQTVAPVWCLVCNTNRHCSLFASLLTSLHACQHPQYHLQSLGSKRPGCSHRSTARTSSERSASVPLVPFTLLHDGYSHTDPWSDHQRGDRLVLHLF